jgi:signal transduction histidine kinase
MIRILPKYINDLNEFERSRTILLFMAFVLSIFGLASGTFTGLFYSKIQNSFLIFLASSLIVMSIGLFYLYYQSFRYYTFLALTKIIIVYCFIFINMWQNGGIYSPGLIWIAFPPLIGFLLTGIRAGSFLSLVGIIMAIYFYKEPPVASMIEITKEQYLFQYAFNIALMIGILGLYYFVYSYLISIAERENNKKKEQVETLLRVILHDISTPLAIIDGATQLLGKDQKTDKMMFPKVKDAANHIKEIITQVRSFQSFSDGKYNLEISNVNLLDLINKQLSLYEKQLKNKNIEIKLEVADDIALNSDRRILSYQIFNNIISNSIKFSHPNSKIVISSHYSNGDIILTIQDYGIGIPKAILGNIYSMFENTNRRGTGGEQGTGYGMPIVKKFVELLEGNILIESNNIDDNPDNHGTKITLKFPKKIKQDYDLE